MEEKLKIFGHLGEDAGEPLHSATGAIGSDPNHRPKEASLIVNHERAAQVASTKSFATIGRIAGANVIVREDKRPVFPVVLKIPQEPLAGWRAEDGQLNLV